MVFSSILQAARASAVSASAIAALILLSSPAGAQAAACPLSESASTVDLERAPAAADLEACGAEALPTLLATLRHSDWQQRAAAAYLLGQLGAEAEPATPALAKALADSHPAVRFTAAGALGQVGSAEAGDTLLNALEDEDESVRANALIALARLGPKASPALPQLFEVLEARGIYNSFAPDASQPPVGLQAAVLQTLLEDGNWAVRSFAEEALVDLVTHQPDALAYLWFSRFHHSGLVKGLETKIAHQVGPEPLLRALQSADPEARSKAAEMLGKLRVTTAVPSILVLLDDPDEATQHAAIEALGQIGSADAVPALLEQLQAGSPTIRQAAAIALGQIPTPDSVAALTAALSSDISAAAAAALGAAGAETAVPALQETLSRTTATVELTAEDYALDNSSSVCRAATLALGRIGSAEAIETLVDALQQENWLLRSCVLRAFGQIPLEDSSEALTQARRQEVPRLVEALQQTWPYDREIVHQASEDSIRIRHQAASALAMVDSDVVPYLIDTIPPETGVPIFIELLQNTSATGASLPRATYRDFREHIGPADDRLVAIANAYLKAAGPTLAPSVTAALQPDLPAADLERALLMASYVAEETTLTALVELLNHPEADVRGAAAKALGRWQVEAAVPGLIPMLQEPGRRVASEAAGALREIGPESALNPLLETLKHESTAARAEAATALGQIGSAAALPALSEALLDEDWEVRRNAAAALGQIGTPAVAPVLVTALEDPQFYVSYAAADALGQLGSAAVPTLLSVFDQEVLPPVLQIALQDYGLQRHRAAIFALSRILDNTPDNSPEGSASTSSVAAAVEGLSAVAQNPQEHPEVRRLATTVLARVGVDVPEADAALSPLNLTCGGIDPHIHLYAGQCIYDDVAPGGGGLYEIYESLRKLLGRR